ncbi:MAG: hypothetical protein IJR49_01170, partial [Treponema sp.]|nr:hypothetical protein [Treponema sp.]
MAEVKENSQQAQEEAQKRAEEKQKEEAARLEELKKRAIIFRMGEETGIVIEKKKEQFEHSLFKEQYKQAFSLIDGILARTTKTNPSDEIDENISNVIAFCGDRGEGKTSALETVRGILLKKDIFKEAVSANLFSENTQLDANKFKVLNLVDPAFFDKEHNLLELLLGQMYAEITDDDKKKAKENDYEDMCASHNVALRNTLMQDFEEVRHSLEIIRKTSEKNAYDNLEQVDELAAGVALKKKVRYLLKNYAQYFQKERVLVCIDDLDLNISEGYKMAEEIRKYLSTPSVCIVMLAIKTEQMVEVVQSYLRDKMNKDIIKPETITDMAERYVTKMLPLNNRVIMPNGKGVVELPLVIKEGEYEEPYPTVKEAVVRLIYRKTRYIFVNGRNVSPIVPVNLRSLRFLINLLWELPDAKRENNADNVENKQIFKNYFYNTWIGLLDSNDAKFAQEIINNPDITTLNKSVVMHLRNLALPTKNQEEHDVLVNILEPQNQVQNISVGDVFYVIKQVESINTDIKKSYFLFFLKAFYSIELYETYDRISANLDSLFVTPSACFPITKEDSKQEKDKTPYIYKYDSQLQRLN